MIADFFLGSPLSIPHFEDYGGFVRAMFVAVVLRLGLLVLLVGVGLGY